MTEPHDTRDKRPTSMLARLKARVLPQMPDFYAMLLAQCEVTAKGTDRLLGFLRDNDAALGMEVRRLEHEGDRLRSEHLTILHRSFSTPMDREDFYDAVMSIDEILNYAKTTVREMEILSLESDAQMAAMASLLDAGAQALRLGFESLEHDPESAGRHADRARKSERDVEKAYREALARLFDPERQLERLSAMNAAGAAAADTRNTLVIVTGMLKRREIYRHLSNAADHVARAAQILQDIVAKGT